MARAVEESEEVLEDALKRLDCKVFYAWTPEKEEWCCKHQGLGCPEDDSSPSRLFLLGGRGALGAPAWAVRRLWLPSVIVGSTACVCVALAMLYRGRRADEITTVARDLALVPLAPDTARPAPARLAADVDGESLLQELSDALA